MAGSFIGAAKWWRKQFVEAEVRSGLQMQLHQIKNPKSKIRNVLLLGVLCLALLPWSSAAAQQGTSNNLLQNPGFEGEYQVRCSYPGGKAWITLPCDSPLPTMP